MFILHFCSGDLSLVLLWCISVAKLEHSNANIYLDMTECDYFLNGMRKEILDLIFFQAFLQMFFVVLYDE